MKEINIKDVARISGVAISTVSRVINNKPDVNEKTKQKVLDVIKSTNYEPNNNARTLKQLVSKNIAVIVKGTQNPLFQYCYEVLQHEIEKMGYSLYVRYIDQHDNEMISAMQVLREKKPCGIIFLGAQVSNFSEKFNEVNVPCITATSPSGGIFANLSSVCINDVEGGYMAADYLIKKGHTKIACIGADSAVTRQRLEGFKKRLKEADINFDSSLYMIGEFRMKQSYDEVRKALSADDKGFSAIFAMSDTMAIGAIKAVCDCGLSVPGDISVIGFDGIDMCFFYNPRITTVKQPIERIAKETLNILINAIENNAGRKDVVFGIEIVEGDSVAEC